MGLVRLLPGVVDTANRERSGWNNLVGVTVNGSRGGTLNLTLDGVSSLDTGSQLGPTSRRDSTPSARSKSC